MRAEAALFVCCQVVDGGGEVKRDHCRKISLEVKVILMLPRLRRWLLHTGCVVGASSHVCERLEGEYISRNHKVEVSEVLRVVSSGLMAVTTGTVEILYRLIHRLDLIIQRIESNPHWS
jgi:hypothetical protein